MSDSLKITPFPASRRERRRLLRRSEDRRLRLTSLLRTVSGWLLLLSTVLFLFTHYTLLTPTNLRQAAHLLHTDASPSADLREIDFPSGAVTAAAPFDSGLAYVDSDTLYVAAPGSAPRLTLQLTYADLSLCTGGNRILAYDRGGTGYTLSDGASVIAQGSLQSPILSASMNQKGQFALVTNEQSYRTAVTVFNEKGAQTYKWMSSEYYIQSAALSPSGKTLAALVFHANGITPEGRLLLFHVGQTEAPREAVLPNALGFEARFLSDKAVGVIGDTGAFVFDTSGRQRAQYGWQAGDPIAFSSTDGMMAVALHSYHAGARAEIRLFSDSGRLSGPLYLNEELEALSLGPDRIAALTSTSLHIYNDELQPLWSDSAAVGARTILMQQNDLVYAVYSKYARLLTPSQSEAPS